jgi:HK97 family phage major capsid protein
MTLTRTIGQSGYDLRVLEPYDITGLDARELPAIVADCRRRARSIHQTDAGELRDKTEHEQREFARLIELLDCAETSLKIRDGFRNPRAVVRAGAETRDRGVTFRGAGYGEVPPRVAEDRDNAMRCLDEYRASDVLSAAAADRLDEVLRGKDPAGATARYLTAAGDPAYGTAFGKMLADPQSGHLRFSPEEVDAVRVMGLIEAEARAMGDATGAGGQFALPLTIDPSIILTGQGVLNPVRAVSNVETIGTYIWKGVSADSVTAAYVAEATEATDNSPTLVQPVLTPQRGTAFVPFSQEIAMDWTGLQSELVMLITDARDVLDATMFLTGSGTNQPSGILNIGALNGLTTTQRVQTLTTATYAAGDPWLLKAQIPPRFINETTFAAAPATWDTTYQFVAQGSTTQARQFSDGDRGGDFLGRPKIEWSTMGTGSATGAKLIIGGNFRVGFKIVDRIGMQASFIPQLFGLARGYPTGQSGLYCWWRTSSGVVALNALRYLEVK